MSQSQTAANPRHQEEEKKRGQKQTGAKQTNAREAHNPAPSSRSEAITTPRGTQKHEDKDHGKTPKHKTPRSINHKATQNENSTETTAPERPVAQTTRGVKILPKIDKPHPGSRCSSSYKNHKQPGPHNGSSTHSPHNIEDKKIKPTTMMKQRRILMAKPKPTASKS